MIEKDVPDYERQLQSIKDWMSLTWGERMFQLLDEAAKDNSPHMRITRSEDIEELKRKVEP